MPKYLSVEVHYPPFVAENDIKLFVRNAIQGYIVASLGHMPDHPFASEVSVPTRGMKTVRTKPNTGRPRKSRPNTGLLPPGGTSQGAEATVEAAASPQQDAE